MNGRGTGRVILGVGESWGGLQALRYAVAEARRRGTTLDAVRTWRCPTVWPAPELSQLGRDLAADAEMRARRAFDNALGGIPTDVEVTLTVAEGLPGEVLVARADRDDDVIVVAVSRRSRHGLFERISVSGYCARHASCPVVAVPPPTLARQEQVRRLHREVQRLVDEAFDRSVGTGRGDD